MSTSVFFIGGYQARPEHIDKWVKSAQVLKPSVAFRAFPWPVKSSGKDVTSWPPEDIVQGWKDTKRYQPVVDAVKACKADKIYIVGHSSGCAVSNAVDDELNDPKRIVLVALDGVTPDDAYNRPDLRMWAAENGLHQSRNFPGMKAAAREKLKVHTAKAGCTTIWALHFSLVNANATDKLLNDDALKNGYNDCEANLAWLELVV